MKEFQALPTAQPKQDSVSIYLSAIDQEEHKKKQEDDDLQAEYNKATKEAFFKKDRDDNDFEKQRAHYTFQDEESQSELENPISNLMAMKHPEIMASIEN